MNFFRTIKDAIYSPPFYKDILNRSFGKAFVYFLLLSTLLTLINLAFIIPEFLKFQNQIPGYINNVVNEYPQELQIQIKNGTVTTNVKEPYFISWPGQEGPFKNLLVIDTKASVSAEQFRKYNTSAWLTEDAIFYRSENSSQMRAYSLEDVKDLTINRSLVESIAGKVRPFIVFFTPLLSLIVFLGLLIAYLSKLLYLLFIALLIWILSKAMKWEFAYWQSYIIAIYAVTLALLLETLLSVGQRWIGFDGFPFMFTIVTLLVVVLNFTAKTAKSPAKKK